MKTKVIKERIAVSAMKEHTTLLRRLTELEDENTRLQLKDAEYDSKLAGLQRQVANLTRERNDQEERFTWVRLLVNGQNLRPRDLGDSRPR